MFNSIDENKFEQAIKNKDYLKLKEFASYTMLADPTFERGETEKVLEILRDKTPEIFESYDQLDFEERLEPSAWDKRYFSKLTYWFEENFSLERVEYIKEVGRAVHQDTAEKYAQSMADQPEAKNTSRVAQGKTATTAPKRGKAQGNTSKNFPLARAIVAAAALVLAIVLLIKYLTK